MTSTTTDVFAAGLEFPECPRWHDGALWLSDMWDHTVYRFDADGTRHVVHRFPDDEDPGGLGWLPDGRMLVVGMLGRLLYRLEGDRAVVHADLRDMGAGPLNDMITGPDGTAYVTQFGREMTDPGFTPTVMIQVDADGTVGIAADDLMAPNGVAITGDGSAMVVAESAAAGISRYRVRDGVLSDRRRVVLTPASGAPTVAPDGLCLDADGGVWVADVLAKRVAHVDADDVVDQELRLDVSPLACVLGGEDRRTLFVCVNEVWFKHDRRPAPTGAVLAFQVATPGEGRP